MRRILRSVVAAALLSVLSLSPGVGVDGAGPFVVDSTGDQPDLAPGDGSCETVGGNCTLRAAIEEANTLPGADVVHFSVGGGGVQTINPASAYVITEPLVVDATTQPGWTGTPLVEIDGSMVTSLNGIELSGGSSAIRGIAFNRFVGVDPIEPEAVILMTGAGGNIIERNFIGTDPSGVSLLSNTKDGIRISSSPSNVVRNNLISGNGYGIIVLGLTSTDTVILGNYVGTDVSGLVGFGNVHGIIVQCASRRARIGDGTPAGRNVVSANPGIGIQACTDAVVQGNYVGTDATGTGALGNGTGLQGFSGAKIGGDTPEEANVIAANAVGLHLAGPGTVAHGNYVGLASDLTPLGNTFAGVIIDLNGSILGGVGLGETNVIAYNAGDGVLAGPNLSPAQQNSIVGNVIHSNLGNGVRITDPLAVENTIRQNSIYSNGLKGIETFNGGNLELPPPVMTGAAFGTACAGCRIDVYGDAVDEGQHYAGMTTADLSGNWSFPGPILGAFVTATTTDASGNTSEFSAPVSNPDTDGDGCADSEELGPNPQQGGDRNPADYFDFFNVTVDKAIDLQDTLSVLSYFGNTGTSSEANKHDRYIPNPLKPYRTAEANNGVDLVDALANLKSFGHSCVAAP